MNTSRVKILIAAALAGTLAAGENSARRENPSVSAPAPQLAAVDEVATALAVCTPQGRADILKITERLFNGGNYNAVRQVCDALLDKNPAFRPFPDGVPVQGGAGENYRTARQQRQYDRELVRYYRARAQYEQAVLSARSPQTEKMVAAAAADFRRLGDNFWRFADPRYRAYANHYAGRSYDYLELFPQAIHCFRQAAQFEPPAELDIENSIRLAKSLQEYAEIIGDKGLARSPRDVVPPPGRRHTRKSLLKEAEQELAKIATQHPQNDRRGDVELMLIELRFNLGAYSDVQYQAQDFIRRANPGTDDYAKAAYYLANAVYRQGDFNEAARLFADALGQKITDARLRGELFLGQGRINAQMAQTASVETRQTFLARAQTALRQAVRLLPYGADWDAAVREFAKVLIEMREFREADKVLRDMLSHPQNGELIVENYYAGLAAQGLGDTLRAQRHMLAVIECCAAGGRDLRYALQALAVLAEIENSASRPAEALAYFRAGAAAAGFLREYDLYAKLRLGASLAQAQLNTFDAVARDAAGRRLGGAVLNLLATANTGNPLPIQAAGREVVFRAGALRDWNNASRDNLSAALASLAELRGRMLTRLREDEFEYVEGKIVFWQAELARRNLVISRQTKREEFLPILDCYNKATDIIDKSIAANPRGAVAASARYLLAEILNASADLRRELAAELRRRGQGADAVPLESEAEAEYCRALNPLGLAIADAESDTALRVRARTLLGNTYLNLAKISKEQTLYYEKGLDALRILVNEPTIAGAEKTAAVRGIATALAGGGRIDEALAVLLPQTARDLASAVQAAELLVQQDQPRSAYKTLAEGVKNAPKNHPAEKEARFMLATLGLKNAADIAPDGDLAAAEKLRNDSLALLQNLADDYSGSDWASKALLALGEYLIGVKQFDKAVEYAENGLARRNRAVVTAQALHLLEGQALLAWGKERKDKELMQKARDSFVKAERANCFDNPLGRKQRAFAIYEQGNVAAALGREEEALRYYGRVFAIFHQEYEPADLARLAAAAIHERHRNYDLAWKILDQGFDKDRLLNAKLRVEQLKKRAESGL